MEVILLGALVLVAALVSFQVGRWREKLDSREEFNDLLGPLRTDLGNLHDRFDHWTKRERRRQAVDHGSEPSPGQIEEPAVKRARLRMEARTRGLL